MATHVIHTRMNRQQVRDFAESISKAIVGTGHDTHGIGQGVRSRVAHAWFTNVVEDFDKKGRGEVGAGHITWPRNSPEYLAYGKGPKSSRMGRGEMPMNRPGGPKTHNGRLGRGRGTGELSKEQLRQWWSIYMPLRNAFMTYMPMKKAKAKAASLAWIEMKKRGAKRLLDTFGDRRDQVLVDRGTLRRSLQPGEITGGADAEYSPSPQQLVENSIGSSVVGSRVPYAGTHHRGRRKLWPNRLPEEWAEDIVGAVVDGMNELGELF